MCLMPVKLYYCSMDYHNSIQAAARYLHDKGFENIDTAIVLGTGLGKLVEHIHVLQELVYEEIPGFVQASVESHKGRLILGALGDKRVAVMQGRFHFYEGYSMQQVTLPVRVMKAIGVRQLLLSNAAGGMNPGYKAGDLVLVRDHINMQSDNPLRGLNSDSYGPRFPDMSAPYDIGLSHAIVSAAARLGLTLHSGVYVAVNGPNLETRAEYRMLKMMGADMVGMSTVPEVIVANQVGLPCAAVSVITDECDPDHLQPVDLARIIAVAREADTRLGSLLAGVVSGA